MTERALLGLETLEHTLRNGGSRNRGYYNLSRVTRMSRRTCIRLRRVASGRLFGHIAHSTWHADSKGSHRLRKLMTNLGRPRGFRIAVTRARCAPWQVRSQFQLVVLISIIISSAPSPSPSHHTSFRSCCRARCPKPTEGRNKCQAGSWCRYLSASRIEIACRIEVPGARRITPRRTRTLHYYSLFARGIAAAMDRVRRAMDGS